MLRPCLEKLMRTLDKLVHCLSFFENDELYVFVCIFPTFIKQFFLQRVDGKLTSDAVVFVYIHATTTFVHTVSFLDQHLYVVIFSLLFQVDQTQVLIQKCGSYVVHNFPTNSLIIHCCCFPKIVEVCGCCCSQQS